MQMWIIVDGRTGEQVGKPYKSRSRASARADKLGNAYGAYRYRVETRSTEACDCRLVMRRDLWCEDCSR